MKKYGIDVSEWQGDIEWELVAAEKDFAIIRAGYGVSYDKKAIRNFAETGKIFFPQGAYWFSYAISEDTAYDEGRVCSDFLENRITAFEYPVFYDFEDDSFRYAREHGVEVTPEMLRKFTDAFEMGLNEGQKYKWPFGVYTNASMYKNFYGDDYFREHPDYYVWIAAWGNKEPAARHHMWQYSSSGRVSGISTNVDLDVWETDVPPIPPIPERRKKRRGSWLINFVGGAMLRGGKI